MTFLSALQTVLFVILDVFLYVLIGRIIVEMMESFSRNFRPPRWFAVCAEVLFVITDPPVKALRRLIPPLRLGSVALDVSVIVLFFIIYLLQMLVGLIL